tara:strand:+ start:56 stop:475 length:420 start_codon:yes stop_codon:yes gene_type:complete
METYAKNRRNKMPNLVSVKEFTPEDIQNSRDMLNKMFLALEEYNKKNNIQNVIYIAKRQPTTRSGSNYFTFHVVMDGLLKDITFDIAKAIETSLNDKMGGTIYRSFGNMDMGFQTLYEMFGSISGDWDDWQSRVKYRYI